MPRKRDAYYTPTWLAEQMVSSLPLDLNGLVLDPAAGEGALLQAAEKRFGSSVRLAAIDVDSQTTRRLRRENPAWVVSNADFLDSRSRTASAAARAARAGLAAVLLNPPFSYRGNGGTSASYRSFEGAVAPAVEFLITALKSFNPAAGFVAILPNGAVEAERNRELWDAIRQDFSVDRLGSPGTSSFPGARVATTIIQLTRRAAEDAVAPPPRIAHEVRATTEAIDGCSCVEVVRGRVPVHQNRSRVASASDLLPLLHTTSMRQFEKERCDSAPAHLGDDAPLVCLSRVGRWQAPLQIDVGRVVLSDCVIGLRPRDVSKLGRLHEWVVENELSIRDRYRGTGAPYLTLSELTQALSQGVWHPHVVPAGSSIGECCCSSLDLSCRSVAG